ncbi:MAG: hypothetical protein Hyperionvirus1_167 [Hyperionvirus sp.]|uniref:Uncharacterized protein n=1 Tax=Hyperionvirus sp. TaxID=2487770 RepID=A0A3G5A5Y1_9VIRU|nr:MAG: hypothetical protein Hyperionvirus1_167 [Hyperionvirus sp.]
MSCVHEVRYCLIPGCSTPAEKAVFNKQFSVDQPFCKNHARKCSCGKPRITRTLFPYRKEAIDQKMIDVMDAAYGTGCVAHELICRKVGCFEPRSHAYYSPISPKYVKLKHLSHYCPTHTPTCNVCGIQKCFPLNTKKIAFLDHCSHCDLNQYDRKIGNVVPSPYDCLTPLCNGVRSFIFTKERKWELRYFCHKCAPPKVIPAFIVDFSKGRISPLVETY